MSRNPNPKVIEKFEIEIPRINGFFQPGEEISGRIIILAHKKCKVEEFNLKFLGKAEVKFTEVAPKFPLKRQASFMSKIRNSFRGRQTQIVLNEEIIQFDPEIQDFTPEQDVFIPPDCIVINNFSFIIPEGKSYPTSIAGKCGAIEYWFETMLRVDGVPDPFVDRIPIVLQNKGPTALDLIDLKPGFLSKIRATGIFGVFSGKTGFKLRLPKRFFTPGEQVEFVAEILNSNRMAVINFFKISIIRKTLFKAKGRIYYDSCIICSAAAQLNKGPKKQYWSDDPTLLIPFDTPPTSGRENQASLIEFEYFLEAEMRILSEGESLRDITPIVIGSRN